MALPPQFPGRLFIRSLCNRWPGECVSFQFGARILIMNDFSRKGAKAQRVQGDESCFAPARLCAGFLLVVVLLVASTPAFSQTSANNYLFNDVHFHLTNYVQEGIDIHDFLKIMGNKVGRVALFGIPLQQQWSYRVDADRGPTY